MTPLEAATHYTERGWFTVPIPHRSKNPGFWAWEQLRLGKADLPSHFSQELQNVGVLLGEPSGWLIDVDLDHPRCVELADQFLPVTPAEFGRAGKLRSHRIYFVSAPVATKKFKSKSAGMLVELRSTGAQTVFPPSTHECGEPITWQTNDAVPAFVDPAVLLKAVEQLANTVKREIGEKASPKAPREKKAPNTGKAVKNPKRTAERIDSCVNSMLRMQMVDQKDGSGRLFAAACRVVEYDLSDADAISAIHEYASQRPFPVSWTDEQILIRIRDAEKRTARGVIRRVPREDGRIKVALGPDEHRVVNETIHALATDTTIYQRGGALVRVIRDQSPSDVVRRGAGSATITFLPLASLRERMTKHAEFTMLVRRGDIQVEIVTHPTPWLVNAVDARGEWNGIRHLTGISEVPVLRPDGTLWQTPGYDAATGVLYEPFGNIPMVADAVSIADAKRAASELFEVVCDFSFESDEHRSAWLAGLLTPLARFAFDGPSPLFLIDANIRGAGKGLLAQTIGQIVLGREMPVSSYAHDSDELRKKITSIALAGDRLIHLDNLEGNFGNDTLDRALTATRWKDRILGKSQEVDLPLIPVWYGTGNNVAVAADTTRRIIHIRLDVLDENPEERSGFKHPDLITHIKENRGRLLAHAFTILRAYCKAGMPRQNVTAFGSFEGWSRLVREAVVWIGQPDPCRTRTKLAEVADTNADALSQLISAWDAYDTQRQGIVVSDVINRLYAKEFAPRDDACVAMRAALENMAGCSPGKTPSPRQVGAKFKSFRRRVVGGRFIDSNPKEYHRQGAVWRLHDAQSDYRDSQSRTDSQCDSQG